MKDIIDERNKREKMQKSIIKYWNVKYSPVPRSSGEMASPAEKEDDQPMDLAVELLKEQEEEKRRVVEEAIEEGELERDKIDAILYERTKRVQDIVEQSGSGNGDT